MCAESVAVRRPDFYRDVPVRASRTDFADREHFPRDKVTSEAFFERFIEVGSAAVHPEPCSEQVGGCEFVTHLPVVGVAERDFGFRCDIRFGGIGVRCGVEYRAGDFRSVFPPVVPGLFQGPTATVGIHNVNQPVVIFKAGSLHDSEPSIVVYFRRPDHKSTSPHAPSFAQVSETELISHFQLVYVCCVEGGWGSRRRGWKIRNINIRGSVCVRGDSADTSVLSRCCIDVQIAANTIGVTNPKSDSTISVN